MSRLKFVVYHWEKDVDPSVDPSPEASVKLQNPFGEGKGFYLHWASFIPELGESTVGSSVEANLLFNETNLKTAVPSAGKPYDSPQLGERLIHRYIAENLASSNHDAAVTNMFIPPEPIKFDDNDYLGIWFNMVNKGSGSARLGIYVVLAISETKRID